MKEICSLCGGPFTPQQVPDEVVKIAQWWRNLTETSVHPIYLNHGVVHKLTMLCDFIQSLAPPDVPLADVTISGETWRDILRTVNPLACLSRGRPDCDCAHCKLRRLVSGANQ